MKPILFFLSVVISISVAAQDLNVMTFNIRYDNKGDSLNSWPYRIDKVVSQVLFHEIHLLGVQEALNDQMADMKKGMPAFKSLGGGRNDGKASGEYSAIFYDTTRLQVLQSQTFWLSETPADTG